MYFETRNRFSQRSERDVVESSAVSGPFMSSEELLRALSKDMILKARSVLLPAVPRPVKKPMINFSQGFRQVYDQCKSGLGRIFWSDRTQVENEAGRFAWS